VTPRAPSKSNLARLAAYGLSPATIATVFDLDVDRVRSALVEQGVVDEVRADEDLRVGVQRVAWRVVEETLLMLDEGSPQAKQKLVTNLFSKMMGMLEQESVDEMSGLREELSALVTEMSTSAPVVDKPQQDVDDDDPA
jgi:hypothetical protein|tara:strand:+ start:1720 stop:2136 length:417 start_codon:yes stop_codon:yes gene_type:complete